MSNEFLYGMCLFLFARDLITEVKAVKDEFIAEASSILFFDFLSLHFYDPAKSINVIIISSVFELSITFSWRHISLKLFYRLSLTVIRILTKQCDRDESLLNSLSPVVRVFFIICMI